MSIFNNFFLLLTHTIFSLSLSLFIILPKKELITKGLSGWLSDEKQTSSSSFSAVTSSNIHSRAGYYKIDVGENVNDGGCILDDEGIKMLNGVEDDSLTTSGSSNGAASNGDGGGDTIGCYLVVSSPKDYEITTTFPLPYPYGFYGRGGVKSEDIGSIEDDIFQWIQCEYYPTY